MVLLTNMKTHKYVVVTAARNEADYIENTIKSLTSQTVKPMKWVIINDGSTDDTGMLADAAAAQHDWMNVIHRSDRGFRKVGGGNVEALYEGFDHVADLDYEFLCVVDADLIFDQQYFECMFEKFDADPELGIAGGRVYDLKDGELVRLVCRSEMTFGALKCWRRECFEDFGGLVRHPGWDGLDCYGAMMNGWKTCTFEDKEMNITHLRPMGSSQKNIYSGRIRRGRGFYLMGAHPLWVMASSLYHLTEPPYFAGPFCVMYGYLKACLEAEPRQISPELAQFVRKWQLGKMLSLFDSR